MVNNHLKTARIFARLMDEQFSIFGIKFGLDSILGLVPWVGDVVTMVLSLYLIWIGWQMKIPDKKIGEMIFNIVLDTGIGIIPVAGDIADLFYKANSKNLKILEEFDRNNENSAEPDIIEGEVIS